MPSCILYSDLELLFSFTFKAASNSAKKAIRIIKGASYNAHTAPLFKSTGILPLDKLAESFKLQTMFDFCRNKLPTSFSETWRRNHERPGFLNLRNADEFYTPMARLRAIEFFPLHDYPRLWNDLKNFNNELADLDQSQTVFNKNIKNFLLDKLETTCFRQNCFTCT